MEIIPAILEKEWTEIEKKIQLVESFARSLHIDVIDGKFAQSSTLLEFTPFKKYADTFLLEAHLMVEEPIQYLKPLADAGFRRFLGHIEQMESQEEFVAAGQLLGEVGLAIDGPTSLEALEAPYDDLDCLLIMTIKAGMSGQQFLPQHLEKVKKVRESSNIPIEVDGGISDTTIAQSKQAGCNRFVTSSFLFNDPNPLNKYEILRHLLSP